MTTKNSSAMQKNNNLTVLRGIFIIMIVLHHLNLYEGGGSLGVAFFFMLGGFALSLGYYDKVCKSDFSFLQYFRRRCEKFFPLHWLCLLAILPLSLWSIIKGIGNINDTILTLIPNALLLQSLIPINSVYFSFNAVSWYLSATMILSVLFPCIVKGLNKLSDRSKIVTLIIILSAYFILVCFLPIEYRHPILYINPFVRVVDFIIGIYLFLLYRKITTNEQAIGYPNRLIVVISLMMIILATVTSIIASKDTVLIAAVYWLPLSVLIISSMIKTDIGGGKIYNLLVRIGDLSFPMFLSHLIVIVYVNYICSFIGLNNKVSIAISLPLIFLVAWLCDKYFLKTVSLWLKKGKK